MIDAELPYLLGGGGVGSLYTQTYTQKDLRGTPKETQKRPTTSKETYGIPKEPGGGLYISTPVIKVKQPTSTPFPDVAWPWKP